MYASIRTYRGDPSAMDEMLHIADEEFVPRVQELPGFCAYQMVDCGDGTLVTVSCFHEHEQAERSVELAADFVRSRLSAFDIERLDARAGAVRVNIAASEVLEPAHV